MTGSQSMTFSPSKVTMSRNTPCIEGWCGPMFSTIGSVLVSIVVIDDYVPWCAGDRAKVDE
ncbi:MAG: hypothetical protein WCD18_00490 [Thermosynechococcaceae cyanobacterium]